MADKLVSVESGTAPDQSQISTSGSTGVNAVVLAFDEATPSAVVFELIERAKIVAMDYYLKK